MLPRIRSQIIVFSLAAPRSDLRFTKALTERKYRTSRDDGHALALLISAWTEGPASHQFAHAPLFLLPRREDSDFARATEIWAHNVTMVERRAKRVRPKRGILVAFTAPGIRLTGYLENLSTRGLLLRCSGEVASGTIGRLGLEVGNEVVRIVSEVKGSVQGVGIAVNFISMGSRDRDLLNRLLSRIEKSP